MTQDEKELLLKDLCVILPYGDALIAMVMFIPKERMNKNLHTDRIKQQ